MAYGNTNDFAALGRQIGQNLGQIGAGQAYNAQDQYEFAKEQTQKAYRGEVDRIILNPDLDARTKNTMVHQIGGRYKTSISEMGSPQQYSYLLNGGSRRADPDLSELERLQRIKINAAGPAKMFDDKHPPLNEAAYNMANAGIDAIVKRRGGNLPLPEPPATANASVNLPGGNISAQATGQPVQATDPIQPVQATGSGLNIPVQIKSDDDYRKLKSGQTYIAPDGIQRTKP
jgi:hypothetical protein